MTLLMWVVLGALMLALFVIGALVAYFVVRFLMERRSNARIANPNAWRRAR